MALKEEKMQTKILKFFVLPFLVFFVFMFFDLSISHADNGIEGNIESYTSQQRSGISLIAETETDIKEELSKAKKTTKSKKDGVFIFKDLIPNKKYRISVNDGKYISQPIYVAAPEKGTRIAKKPLLLALLPPKGGIWFYDSKHSKFIDIYQGHKPVKIRSHSRLGGSGGLGRSHLSAFSVHSKDIFNPAIIRKNKGYIFVFNDDIEDFAKLNKIIKQGIASIPDGYYYNIRDFYGDRLKPAYDKPNLSHKITFKDRGLNLNGFSLSNLVRGIYIITTKIEKQNMSRILGGERAPREGYLLHVTEGDEYTANLYLNKKDYNSAIKIFKQCLKKLPNDLMLLQGLFLAYTKSNQFTQGISIADEILRQRPCSQLYYQLGDLYLRVGNEEKAIANFKRSLQLNFSQEKVKTKLSSLLNKDIANIIQEDKELKLALYKREFSKNKGIPIPLKSHKIGAYINFRAGESYPFYPRNYASFMVENENDGSDFKVPAAKWENLGYKKSGKYFIKGGDVEQTLYFEVNPLQIEFTDNDLNKFISMNIKKKYGKGVKLRLKPHKIGAYINFRAGESYPFYPRNYASFMVENENDGSDFKVPAAKWENLGYKKSGKYFIKGGDVEQTLYFNIDPSQVRIVED